MKTELSNERTSVTNKLVALPAPLMPFAAYDQFILRHGKIPFCPVTMRPCNAHDPANWMSAEMALANAEMFGAGYGIGFVFTDQDPFWFLDIDHCIDSSGQFNEIAKELLTLLAGCAVEISMSGTGLHLFGIGYVPPHRNKNVELGIELYTEKRFVALTGNML